METPIFTGSAVALITPMYENGDINLDVLEQLIEYQIANGTDAIVICGTTGESAAMTDSERLSCIQHAVKVTNHRVPVIAGTGSNNTKHSAALSKKAAVLGVDALLLVTPYYNKTSQSGLIRHFNTIINTAKIPAILYNVPSRTGVNIEPETVLRLTENPYVVGIKEASGNISQIAKIANLCKNRITIYSGNDDQVVPVLSLGGKGVISVVSNIDPRKMHNCCQAWFDKKIEEALALQMDILPLCNALFCDINPIPVKYAMQLQGWAVGNCRLPLVAPSPANKDKIYNVIQHYPLYK